MKVLIAEIRLTFKASKTVPESVLALISFFINSENNSSARNESPINSLFGLNAVIFLPIAPLNPGGI